jgi:purine nucleoside phosphorylase
VLRTPYGEPSGAVTFGQICGRPVAFLARHGYGHTIPPHEVNYQANIWALCNRGVTKRIVSVASVGSIRADLKPGDVVIPHQIIDYTWGRKSTFHEGPDSKVVHIDFTEPYDEALRRVADSRRPGLPGSPSAIRRSMPRRRVRDWKRRPRSIALERDGADVVGMTGMPEASLARELGVPYAAISVVANYAAGRGDSRNGISFEAIEGVCSESMGHVRTIIERLVGCGDPTCS